MTASKPLPRPIPVPDPVREYPAHQDRAADAARPNEGSYDAVVFDMDGVITDTASVHSRAWKQMFDEFLRCQATSGGPTFQEFNRESDYRRFIDGKPRHQGVVDFLRSRGFELPWGQPGDAPGAGTICGLGNRKNALFYAIVIEEGVRTFPSSVNLVHALRATGIRVGLATSSRNAELILRHAHVAHLFAAVVDGLVSEQRRLKGKPEPDIFLAACGQLGSNPARTVIVEDAVSGVQAGARGGFALVVGVARQGQAAELRENGADVVVADLAELTPEWLHRKVRLKGRNV